MKQDFFSHTVQWRQHALGNKMLIVECPYLPFSSFSLWYPVGARKDPQTHEGLAHMSEHLFLKQTKRFPSQVSLTQELAKRGILSNAFTTYETTHFFYTSLTHHAAETEALFIENFSSVIDAEKEFEQERKVILDEIARAHDDPSAYVYQLSQQALFPETTLSQPIAGSAQSVQATSYPEYIQWKKEQLKLSKGLFLYINPASSDMGSSAEPAYAVADQATIHYEPPIPLSVHHREMTNVQVAIQFRTTAQRNVKERIALDLLREVLANSWHSVLIQRLRLQENLTYWVEGWSEHFADTGYIRFLFSTDPAQTTRAIQLALEEIEKCTQQLLSEDLLKQYKNAYEVTMVSRHLEPASLLWWYGWQVMVGEEVMTLREYMEAVESVTPTFLREVARRYFVTSGRSIVCLGSIDEKEMEGV